MSQSQLSRRTFLASAAAGTMTAAALASFGSAGFAKKAEAATGSSPADTADTANASSSAAADGSSTVSTATVSGPYDTMAQFSSYARNEKPEAVAATTAEEFIEAKGDGVLSAGGMVDKLGISAEDFMANVPAWLGTEPQTPDPEDTVSCDVLVIGAGNAGSVAALRAQELGCKVILAETQTYNEYDEYACDMACYNNRLFLEKGTPEIDPMDIFYEYMRQYRGHAHQKLVRDYATRSGEMFDWMLGYIPEDLTEKYAKTSNYKGNDNFSGAGNGDMYFRGMVQWRDEDSNVNMWPYVIRSLHTALEEKGGTLLWGHQAVKLLKSEDGSQVTGAVLRDVDDVYHQVDATAVIVCAGDFGGNPDMRLDLADTLRNLAWSFGNDRTEADNTNGLGRDGSGIKMCLWAGATMEAGPRAGQAAGINGPAGMAFGGTWPVFGTEGRRFYNESLIRHGSNGYLDMLPKGEILLSVTDSNWEEYLSHQGYGHETMDRSSDYMCDEVRENMEAYVTGADGFPVRAFSRFGKEYTTMYAADTLEEVAQIAGLDEDATAAFVEEVAHWNEMCEAGHDSDWGIDPQLLMPIKDAPFFFNFTTTGGMPSGGLCQHAAVCTNGRYQVTSADKQPITGLYAAGNSCGQRMGIQYSTPTAGNSCGSALTSGYCAAECAAEDVKGA